MCAGSARGPQHHHPARPLPLLLLLAVLEQPGWAELGAAAPWGAKALQGFLALPTAAGTAGAGCVGARPSRLTQGLEQSSSVQ